MKQATEIATKRPSLVEKLADKYSVDPTKMLATLKATAFKQSTGKEVTNEEMMALLIVADQYNLNPFLREIYAFPGKNGGIHPIVPIDGWLKIINSHPQFDGMVTDDTLDKTGKLIAVTCTIYRKDRQHPTTVTEYMAECYRETNAWKWKARMLRHKAVIQSSRYAFSLSGISDPDEAERIIEGEVLREERPAINMPKAIGEPEPDQAEAAPTGELTDGQKKVITAQLSTAGITMGELLTHFKVSTIDQLGASSVNEVLGWIADPG